MTAFAAFFGEKVERYIELRRFLGHRVSGSGPVQSDFNEVAHGVRHRPVAAPHKTVESPRKNE
ncbi:hypothetical protein [Bradyrhizobium retamae]|uniref:Uncharacterized protein n=1 Tax=Bradyrhizobium retamae TaxID=1300035 RepID=A0A0R3MBA3_9BRAD|nr:hypothetical protein [Bradyrhizobium retamae]KRR17464.1 hypothetical protein CQ13_36425 [Bradyrhizobium retamae]